MSAEPPNTTPSDKADASGASANQDGSAEDSASGESPLDHVIDDSDHREESEEWAYEEMVRGRTAEEVAADLVASGWGDEEAAEMAEAARRRTRHLRGVTTRDEVARGAEARYRQGMAVGRMLFLGGIFGAAIQFRRVLTAFIGSLRRRPSRPSRRDEPDQTLPRDESTPAK